MYEFEVQSRQTILKIEALCHKLLGIDHEISLKRQELEVLTSIRSPITRLPTEILSSIFEALVTLEPGCFNAQHRLIKACKLWKHLVLENPIFWRTFKAVFPYHTHHIGTIDLKYLKLLTGLSRVINHIGRKLPLNLLIEDPNTEDEVDSEDESNASVPPLKIQDWHAKMVDLFRDPIWIPRFTYLGSKKLSNLVFLNIEYEELQAASSFDQPTITLTGLEHLAISSTFDLTLEDLTCMMESKLLKSLRLTAISGTFAFSSPETPLAKFIEQNSTLFSSLTHLSLIRIKILEIDFFSLLYNLLLLTHLELLYGAFGRGRIEDGVFYIQDKRIVEFLTVSDLLLNQDPKLEKPVVPLLRSIYLYDGQSHRGIYPGTQHLARMAISRCLWAMQLPQNHVLSRSSDEEEAQRSFEGSPFQLVLRIEPMRFRMVRRRMEDAIGALHRRLFKAEPQLSNSATV
ncbi:hypothetical protein CPB83DRAFT_887835 [Crepidotus variabilis]|uniref:F-box domain-containing protein n=1 Tax=Crepidotus variabilis TaxID=179855 RepID=A0A9P6E3G5_9AGAR|nr:hypothetical protein CPB83DRAFT_887835 [Crepidotus variabilis]